VEKTLFIDPEKCTGCRICELICSFQDTFNPYHSKVKIKKNEEWGIDLPVLCLHCEEAFCAQVCPEGAIQRSPEGLVSVESTLCHGCQACAEGCPYGAIRFVKDQICKCDLCGGDPLCAKWCPTGAISFKEISAQEIRKNREEIQKILRRLENSKREEKRGQGLGQSQI
jgi:carbon-monoxide dehydrogenase iron sulfur subunit